MSDIDYEELSHQELRVILAQRDYELDEWRKLQSPVALHQNLLRGIPARLDQSALLHLAGATDYPHAKESLVQAKALLADADRMLQRSLTGEDISSSSKAMHLLHSINTFLKMHKE